MYRTQFKISTLHPTASWLTIIVWVCVKQTGVGKGSVGVEVMDVAAIWQQTAIQCGSGRRGPGKLGGTGGGGSNSVVGLDTIPTIVAVYEQARSKPGEQKGALRWEREQRADEEV